MKDPVEEPPVHASTEPLMYLGVNLEVCMRSKAVQRLPWPAIGEKGYRGRIGCITRFQITPRFNRDDEGGKI